jgi:DNA-binding protein HU-beta
MNKNDLVKEISKTAGISKEQAGKVLSGIQEAITEALSKGDKLSLIGG